MGQKNKLNLRAPPPTSSAPDAKTRFAEVVVSHARKPGVVPKSTFVDDDDEPVRVGHRTADQVYVNVVGEADSARASKRRGALASATPPGTGAMETEGGGNTT